MSVTGLARRPAATIDDTELTHALQAAALGCDRLSDEDIRAMRRRRRTRAVSAGVAATGILAAFLTIDAGWLTPTAAPAQPWTRTLATRAGETGTLRLTDGSTIRLDGATRVRVVYTGKHRSAELLAGQAYFDIRHDVSRPFHVRAGAGPDAGEVHVLGTAFDLDLTRRKVGLAVYRGAVDFAPATPGAARPVLVRAGYRSSLAGGRVAPPARFDPTLPDWQQGWIDTPGMRLDDLAEVLDRRGDVRIAPPPEPLASTMIVGRFRTDSPRRLLAAMGAGFGFAVADRDGVLTIEPAAGKNRPDR